jgi:hypothetical protein
VIPSDPWRSSVIRYDHVRTSAVECDRLRSSVIEGDRLVARWNDAVHDTLDSSDLDDRALKKAALISVREYDTCKKGFLA